MNRTLVMSGAVVALFAFCGLIVAGGRALEPPPVQLDAIDDTGLDGMDAPSPDAPLTDTPSADIPADDVLATATAETGEPPAGAGEAEQPGVTVPTRLVAPAEVAAAAARSASPRARRAARAAQPALSGKAAQAGHAGRVEGHDALPAGRHRCRRDLGK